MSELRGSELLRLAFNQIAAHPETWNQNEPWFLGNGACCLLGHARALCDREKSYACCEDVGITNCGLSRPNVSWVFDPDRTMPELRAFVAGQMQVEGNTAELLPVPEGY